MPPESPSSRAAKARPRNRERAALKPSGTSPASGPGNRILEHHNLRVVWRAVEDVRPYERNPRRHPPKQIAKLAASIAEFGFLIAILIDRESRIIAGHARHEAAKRLGLPRVPTIEVDHLSEAQVRAFRIADNRLAELATWDRRALTFELAEIDILIERAEQDGEPDKADEVPELNNDMSPVSRVGDLWLLGEHRLLCADALQAANYERPRATPRAVRASGWGRGPCRSGCTWG